jgi:hypothetical protein
MRKAQPRHVMRTRSNSITFGAIRIRDCQLRQIVHAQRITHRSGSQLTTRSAATCSPAMLKDRQACRSRPDTRLRLGSRFRSATARRSRPELDSAPLAPTSRGLPPWATATASTTAPRPPSTRATTVTTLSSPDPGTPPVYSKAAYGAPRQERHPLCRRPCSGLDLVGAASPSDQHDDRTRELADELQHCGWDALASEVLGRVAFPVDAAYFDKQSTANWSVPAHQDRVLPVAPDSGVTHRMKRGVAVAEPSPSTLARMLALRLHFDPTDENSGALCVAPRSHASGVHGPPQVQEIPLSALVPCSAHPGDVLLMRPLLLHRSSPSKGASRRRVLHVFYTTERPDNGLRWRGFVLGGARAESRLTDTRCAGLHAQSGGAPAARTNRSRARAGAGSVVVTFRSSRTRGRTRTRGRIGRQGRTGTPRGRRRTVSGSGSPRHIHTHSDSGSGSASFP